MRMTDPAVRAEDLVLGYEGRVAIDRSTFEIPKGKVTAMIGPNGSGKSTVLNAIAGLVAPIAGDLRVMPEASISYVLQNTKINEGLPISVGEVVAMGRYRGAGFYRRLTRDDRAAVERAMRRTGVADLSRRSLHELSGGQRQRVFLAQGLAQPHNMLLLDEPLSGVDLTSALAIDEVIHEEIDAGTTVVISTHDLSEAQIAHHVLLLASRVIASGPPDEVLSPEHLADAYGPTLLHITPDRIFVDDAAHQPVEGRHVHRDRAKRVQ